MCITKIEGGGPIGGGTETSHICKTFVVTTNDGKIRKDAVTSTNVSVIRLCDILVQLGAPHESNPSIKGGYLDQGPHG